MSENQKFNPIFKKPVAQEPEPVDRAIELTLRYNYLKELKAGSKPDLYGPGIDFYEEERIRCEQSRDW